MRWVALAGLAVSGSFLGCNTETPKGPAPSGADSAQAAAPGSNASASPARAGSASPRPEALETASALERPAPIGVQNVVIGAEGNKPKDAKDGNASAPAAISASIRPGSADISVAFGADAKGVVIKVWGADGLTVTKGATPTALASVKSAESTKVAVQFTAPTYECNLTVSVSGTFGGREQTKVQSFTVNPGVPKPSLPAATSPAEKDAGAAKATKVK